MQNINVQLFNFKGNQLHALTDPQGDSWFIAKDACDILGIATNHLGESLDADEMNTLRITEGTSGNPNKTIISEPGLYKLIMRSRKPEAKDFQRWVTHEVLLSIRRHGGYIPQGESPEETMARAILIAQSTISAQKKQIDRQMPKVLFANAVETSNIDILVGELAKILKGNGIEIGQTRLFQWLRDNGYLMKSGSSKNMPTQRSMELGLFRIKETTVVHSDGRVTINKTPKVTGKGQTYFVNKFLGEKGNLR